MRINRELLNFVAKKAALSIRKREVYRIHQSDDDPLQRMLNAVEPGSYVQPHKHENPDKRELFFCLRGRMAVIIFNDDGELKEVTVLDPSTESYGVEVAARTYHTIVSLQAGSVAFEVKDGPWDAADDKHFAAWAPAEGQGGAARYLEELKDRAGL